MPRSASSMPAGAGRMCRRKPRPRGRRSAKANSTVAPDLRASLGSSTMVLAGWPKKGAKTPESRPGSWSGRMPIMPPWRRVRSRARTPLASVGTSCAPLRSRPRSMSSFIAINLGGRYMLVMPHWAARYSPVISQLPRCGESMITPRPRAMPSASNSSPFTSRSNGSTRGSGHNQRLAVSAAVRPVCIRLSRSRRRRWAGLQSGKQRQILRRATRRVSLGNNTNSPPSVAPRPCARGNGSRAMARNRRRTIRPRIMPCRPPSGACRSRCATWAAGCSAGS